MNYCNVGETCCVTPGPSTTDAGTTLGSGSYAMSTCVAGASTCTLGVALACSGASDCPQSTTQLCCAQGSLTTPGGSTSCQTATACPAEQVCLSSSECPSGDKCRALAGGGGIRTCVAAADGGSSEGGPGNVADAAAE